MSEDFLNLEKKPEMKTNKEFSLSVTILVIVLVLVGILLFFREQYGSEMLSMITSGRAEIEQSEPEEVITLKEEEKTSYIKVVRKGEGLTHIARRAVADYIKDKELDLSPEEKVYMEDYIQRRVPLEEDRENRWLFVGEEIEVSINLIEEALQETEHLTSYEVNNLSNYALLVSFSS